MSESKTKRTKKSEQLLEIKPQSQLLEIRSKKQDVSIEKTPATEATKDAKEETAAETVVAVTRQLTKPSPATSPEAQPPTQAQETPEASTPEVTAKDQEQKVEIPHGTMFQAIGVICGDVTFTQVEDKVQSTIKLAGKEYPLFYAPKKQRAYDALKKEVEATGQANQRLVVYPRFIHFPGRDQTAQVSFQVVGFDKGREQQGASVDLQDLEFKLSGLWQFIPVCKTPCISVFRNFTKERLEHVKQSEPAKKVKFMKASHLPLFWRDAPVPPFRFNPKAEKEQQGKPVFVQIKARFQPSRDAFEFNSLLAVPLEKAPKFLKVSKEDKAIALKAKRDAERSAGRDTRPPQGNPPFKPKGDFKPQASGDPKEMPKPKPKPKQ